MLARVGLYLLGFTLVTTSFSTSVASPHRSASLKASHITPIKSIKSKGSVELSPAQMPRESMYGVLFREIARFNAKADELAAQSKSSSFLRNHHRNFLELSEPLNSQLRQVALNCVRDVDGFDRRAGAIIKSIKERYRGKRALVPPLPQELRDLQEARKQRIIAAADQLAGVFGQAQFAYFESLVRRYVGAQYRPIVTGR